MVDVRDETMGAWFEAKIVKITSKAAAARTSAEHKPEVDKVNGSDDKATTGENLDVNKNISGNHLEEIAVAKTSENVEEDEALYSILFDG